MIKSIFNSEIRISEDRTMLYNSLSDKFCFINNNILNKWESSDYLKVLDSSIINKMKKFKFIVNDNNSEFSNLLEKFEKIESIDTNYMLIINPTMNCNLRCWYCYEEHLVESEMKIEVIDSIKQYIENVLKNKKLETFTLSFFGGEPFLKFDKIVMPLLDYFYKICDKYKVKAQVSYTTNASLLNKSRILRLSKYPLQSFQITLDGNEYCHNLVRYYPNNRGTYGNIIKNIKHLLSIKKNVTVRINITNKNITNILEIIDEFANIPNTHKDHLTINLQEVWQEKISKDLIEEMLIKFRSKCEDNEIYTNHDDRHKLENPCYADLNNSVVINYNGDVYKCTARNFTKKNRNGILLNGGIIKWDINSIEKRKKSLLGNPFCKKCRIFPLCGGGCSQIRIENSNFDSCTYSYTDEDIDDIILSRFENKVMSFRNDVSKLICK